MGTGQIDKLNGKTGAKAARVINVICPSGKCLFKTIWNRSYRRSFPFACGFYGMRDAVQE